MWKFFRTIRQRWSRLGKSEAHDKLPENSQIALPERADLPLRERARQHVAVPARLDGGWMGSGRK